MLVAHARDQDAVAHLDEAARVLALPLEANGMHWHPFGVYAIPLAKRPADGTTWSRRLHVWHPAAEPVGPASPYGVHTHSGTARSHVLLGALRHHLYTFERADGPWKERSPAGTWETRLVAHVEAATTAGTTHILPADQAHGVSRHGGLSVSLFEQAAAVAAAPFTTWQRTDIPAEPLEMRPPVPVADVLREARLQVERALHEATTQAAAP